MRYFLIFILSILPIYSQQYSDYIGAGHANGITVTASSSQSRNNWTETAHPSQTINAKGLDAAVYETSRFLAQSTFGTNRNYILNLSNQDFEAWIDAQFLKNSVSIGTSTNEIYLYAKLLYEMNGGNPEDYTGPDATHFLYAWWQVNMNNEDLLRQRVALALSEIFVISWNSNLEVYGDGFGYYYDVLKNNAFGNFEDLMMDVTLHPMMGGYLSHYNNPKTDTNLNIHPDENYAREIMQLFSIGLHELNQDGSYVLDSNNNRIPTYSNDDIKEFAKVFTGLGPGAVIDNPYGVVANFGVNFYFARKDVPMVVYNNKHEYGPKYLLNGFVIPQGQTGIQDVEMAVNHLFNHPNVGPFIAKRLIQQLVKSNPSSSYISRVAAAFNNTNGVRGDMKAVIKAILLDEEARSCDWINHPNQGKLKEPMLRYFNIARQIDHVNPSGLDWNVGYNYYMATGQTPLGSPSVFNFFLPDFSPNGSISNAGLVAPEFQIHNSISSIAYLNEVDLWTYPELGYSIYDTYGLGLDDTILDFTTLKYYAQDTEVLINELDKLFTHGLLSQETRQTIKTAVEPIMGSDPNIDYLHYRVKMAIYLLLISPDYTILK